MKHYIDTSTLFDALAGAELISIRRIAATGDFIFTANQKEYVFRIQSAFRLVRDKTVLLANLDIFQPSNELENSENFSWDNFNWDVKGNNLFDTNAPDVLQSLSETTVEDIELTSFGDITITFSNDTFLQTFSNASNDEQWRLFGGDLKNDIIFEK